MRRFIELHGESRFTRWGDAQQDYDDNPLRATVNRAGFRRAAFDGGTEYFILPEVWKAEVCTGHDAGAVAKALMAAGMLKVGSDGKLQVKVRLPGAANPVRCYHVLPSIQGGRRCRELIFLGIPTSHRGARLPPNFGGSADVPLG